MAQSPAAPAAAAPSPEQQPPPGTRELVITNPAALACQDAAKIGDFSGDGVEQCTKALTSGMPLSQHDLVAVYTDRGGVYLQHRKYPQAKADFDAALKLAPTTADALVNRGAALLGMRQYAEAIADIDRGLALGPDQPERAYLNRGLANRHLNDLKSAYQDFLKASEINPSWPAPRAEMVGLSP